jgi:hypothetical protein
MFSGADFSNDALSIDLSGFRPSVQHQAGDWKSQRGFGSSRDFKAKGEPPFAALPGDGNEAKFGHYRSLGGSQITEMRFDEDSRFYAAAPWLDFYMSQAKSGSAPKNTAYDAAALVLGDWSIAAVKPTMMGEHRYESGTREDPLIQRRSLYQCVFAGGFGYAYGHDALWQMTPHTGPPFVRGEGQAGDGVVVIENASKGYPIPCIHPSQAR